MSFGCRIIALGLLAIVLGAGSTVTLAAEVKGSCADVYKAPVCTWTKMKGDTLLEVGVVVPIAAIENAPPPDAMAWPPVPVAVLDIPEAARQKSGLVHFSMYWEAGGHPPATYMTPHFDFHFNTIPSAERSAIDCSDLSKPAVLPAAYMLPDIPLPSDMAKMMGVPALVGLCVPQMGMHAIPASDFKSKKLFRGSMIIGYVHGKPIFLEPMVTKAMLMNKKSFDLAIPKVTGFAGAHPTKFHAEYDVAKQEYRMVFSKFTKGS